MSVKMGKKLDELKAKAKFACVCPFKTAACFKHMVRIVIYSRINYELITHSLVTIIYSI